MKTPIVIYHGNCQDGFTAAWACWLAHPDWEFVPGVYGENPTDVSDRDVYLLDYSYKRPVLLAMAETANSITILDHHKTAEAELNGLLGNGKFFGTFDMNHSGAVLSWKHFHPNTDVPIIVQHVEDRDLWLFNLKDTRVISAALFSYPYDFTIWSEIVEYGNLYDLAWEGTAIERKHHKDIAELVAKCRYRDTIGGVEVWVANLPYTLASDACNLMCANENTFAASYYDTETQRIFSLRSNPNGMDVSEIARQYGGGGHKHAAGFSIVKPKI